MLLSSTVRLFLFSAALLVLARPAAAQPATSSVQWLDPGQTIRLQGSGYGTRGDFSPTDDSHLAVGWLTFEAGLTGGPFYIDSRPYQWSIVANGRTPGGSTARKVRKDNDYGSITLKQQGTTGTWFMSFWISVPAQQQSGKLFRWYASLPTKDIYLSTGGGTYPGADLNLRGFSECTACSPTPKMQWSSATKLGPQWRRVDLVIKEQPDEVSLSIDGKLQWSKKSPEGQRWVQAPVAANNHTMNFGADLDGPKTTYPAVGQYNFDDIYVDYSLARVELCDTSSWSSCTHREIQPLKSWSTSRVDVTFNRGSFTPGTTAYLFVVDPNGNVSNGSALVIPSGGPQQAAPTNLRVVTP